MLLSCAKKAEHNIPAGQQAHFAAICRFFSGPAALGEFWLAGLIIAAAGIAAAAAKNVAN